MALYSKKLQEIDLRNPQVGLKQLLEQVNYLQDQTQRAATLADKRLRELEKQVQALSAPTQ